MNYDLVLVYSQLTPTSRPEALLVMTTSGVGVSVLERLGSAVKDCGKRRRRVVESDDSSEEDAPANVKKRSDTEAGPPRRRRIVESDASEDEPPAPKPRARPLSSRVAEATKVKVRQRHERAIGLARRGQGLAADEPARRGRPSRADDDDDDADSMDDFIVDGDADAAASPTGRSEASVSSEDSDDGACESDGAAHRALDARAAFGHAGASDDDGGNDERADVRLCTWTERPTERETRFARWLECHARVAAEPGFLAAAAGSFLGTSRHSDMLRACEQFEGELLALQEGLATGAWNAAFYSDFRARPIMRCRAFARGREAGDEDADEVEPDESDGDAADWCEVCGRRNHPAAYVLTLGGPAYDGAALWRSRCWEQELVPHHRCLDRGSYRDEDDDSDGAAIAPVSYRVGRTCHVRVALSHSLFHYKLRCVRPRASVNWGSAPD